MFVILFNSPTGSADKVNVGRWVECSVETVQGQCPGLLLVRLVGMMVVKIQMERGACDLAAPSCLEWSMWAEVASGTVLSFGGVGLSWPADDRAVIGTRLPGKLP
jgi:hypothetical protein